MRRLISILLLLIIFTSLTLISCGRDNDYMGDHADLYTVANNSVLWLNGYSWGADFECDPKIEVIDKDMYGRIMFTYYEKYYKGADISFSSLIICQASNEKEAFYYEDVNYIIKKQTLYAQDLKAFNNEEIEYLKFINDWNQEIDYSKCIKKEIIRNKPIIPNRHDIIDAIADKFALVDSKYSLFMDFLTSNSNNSSFIVYGYIQKQEGNNLYFIGLAQNKDNSFRLDLIVPLNPYDYKEELVEFKKSNNWY